MHQFQVISPDHTEPDSTPEITNLTNKPEPDEAVTPIAQTQPVKTSPQSQETPKKTSLEIAQAFSFSGVQSHKSLTLQNATGLPRSPQPPRPKAHLIGEDIKIKIKR